MAERRAYGLQQMKETRRELFPDLYPTTDNFPLYQSFLEKYKLGTILNEVFRLKYYNTLFPAMDTMRNTLSDIEPQQLQSVPNPSIDYSTQSSRDKSSPQVLASTFNTPSNEEQDDLIEEQENENEDEDQTMYQMNNDEDDEKSDEYDYDYEYEYEYETDDEYEEYEDGDEREYEEDDEYEEEAEEEEKDDKK